jgi:transposase InsO family protein/transposase-like protein
MEELMRILKLGGGDIFPDTLLAKERKMQYDMKQRTYTKEIKEKAVQMKIDGISSTIICQELNIQSESSIRDWYKLYKNGYTLFSRKPPNLYTDEIKAKAVEMKMAGISPKIICKELNIKNPKSIRDWYSLCIEKNIPYTDNMANILNFDSTKKPKIDYTKLSKEQLIEIAKENEQLQFERDCAVVYLNELKKLKGSVQKNKKNTSTLRNSISQLSPKYSTVKLCKHFEIPKSTYYEKPENPRLKWLWYKQKIKDWCEINKYSKGKLGRREVIKDLKKVGIEIHERQLRPILKELGWNMRQRRSMRKYSSYKNDGNLPTANWLYNSRSFKIVKGKRKYGVHYFNPDNPWEILGTDVTEFHIDDIKIYLSVIIDFYDSRIVAWSVSKHPNKKLMFDTLKKVIKLSPFEKSFILHSDQGCVYRSPNWKKYCRSNNILQSMSRKGKSGDNAPVEGFFGRLKQMWFNESAFKDYTYEKFKGELDEFLNWYQTRKINEKELITKYAA